LKKKGNRKRKDDARDDYASNLRWKQNKNNIYIFNLYILANNFYRLLRLPTVVTMSGFRAAPRRGHLARVRRIYGYLARMNQAKIRVRVEEPDYSGMSNVEFDWSRTVYGAVEEMVANDAPTPLGSYVTLSHFVDANLMHDLTNRRSMTGLLHLMIKLQ
jgi:hypothetical protein